MFGFLPDDFDGGVLEVWPENWPAVSLFMDCATQWRVSMSGAYGLDYQAVKAVMDIRGISGADAAAVFDDILILESAALNAMREGE